jgi:thiol:disulfide interchange protein DsbD
MKLLTGGFLLVALVVGTQVGQAQSPFTVTPRVEANAQGSRVLHVGFAVPANHLLYADKLVFKLGESDAPVGFQLPEPVVVKDKFSGKDKREYTNSFEATYALPAGVTGQKLTVHFQGCDEANCFFPEDQTFSISAGGTIARLEDAAESPSSETPAGWQSAAAGFSVVSRGSGYLNEKEFLGLLDKTKSGGVGAEGVPTRSGFWGVLLTMGLIVLGGVALNLTPCILPMIPINLAIIGAGAQAGSKRRGFALGATYAAGMAIAYGVLGLVVVLTGSKFGTLNSSPWFNLGIASVFLFLALAMFDIVSVDLSRFQNSSSGGTSESRSKFVVAYTMGTVAALLAGACVAPVVISVLLQATTLHAKGVTVGLLLPFLLGLGMGLPWPFAGAGLSFLPKPGKWMMRVKYGFGVMIILFAAYYGHLAFGLFRSESEFVAQARGADGGTEANAKFTEELTKAFEAAKADGKPVFIDFWASWCKNCSAMEHTTFASSTVKQRLSGFHEVRFQAERPNQSPAKEVLDHFNVMGLPSYVVLSPKTREAAHAGQLVSSQK